MAKQIQIDWTRAPKWAQWFAVDDSGDGWFYDKKPLLSVFSWVIKPSGREFAGTFDSTNWQKSLQERPKK